MYTWGAGADEVDAVLPGDELVAAGGIRTTRAVTINAPADAVWLWLAQIGEDRGGFYSYSRPERSVGARIHNADTVHPEWQELHAGDAIWLARRYGEGAREVIAAVEPKSHLVLMSPDDFDRLQHGERPPAHGLLSPTRGAADAATRAWQWRRGRALFATVQNEHALASRRDQWQAIED